MNELLADPDELQRTHAIAAPAARLRAIRQRLAGTQAETGSARLVTMVAAVEALARSLVVHAAGRPASSAEMRHKQFRHVGPVELVEEVLRLHGALAPAQHFDRDTWELFEVAVRYRELVVHECSSIGPDRSTYLIAAANEVLEALVELAGLAGRPRAVA